jgi:predicted AAA+ superfamily ATPase
MTGLSKRHVEYALHAARVLGWLASDGSWAVTQDGKKLVGEGPGGLGERSRFRNAIEQSVVLRRIAPGLLSTSRPSKQSLTARIKKCAPALSEETAARRAQTLLAWREQALDPQLPLPAPEAAPPDAAISQALIHHLHRMNPWWQGNLGPPVPPTPRDFVHLVERRMKQGLAPIVVVRGPRQVGKTTAQLQIIERLLANGVPPSCILRVQCDELPSLQALHEPVLTIVQWYEARVLGRRLNATARANQPTYLFFDEVQNLSSWTAELKHLVDTTSTRVVVTGSSALRIGLGRDSLAGRIHTIEVGTLTLREISSIRFGETLPSLLDRAGDELVRAEFWLDLRRSAEAFQPTRQRAFREFARRGGYPIAHRLADEPWADIALQLNETVVQRVITHDLRVGDRGRKRDTDLLEEVFRLGCRYVGQTPGPQRLADEARTALHANVGTERIRHYLRFLDLALLLRLVKPLEIRLKRSRGAPKLCVVDHGLRASWLQEIVPLEPEALRAKEHLCDLAGHIVESIVGTYLLNLPGLSLSHFPARPDAPEVDFVITVGDHRIPVEVKYRRRIDVSRDLLGLQTFMSKAVYNAPFGLLVTQEDVTLDDQRIICLPLPSLLSLY